MSLLPGVYQGWKFAPSEGDLIEDIADIPPCYDDGDRYSHNNAKLMALMAVTRSNVVCFTRRMMFPSYEESPGSITGRVMGGSTNAEGRIYLSLDNGYSVDVTDPTDWHWEVFFDGPE